MAVSTGAVEFGRALFQEIASSDTD